MKNRKIVADSACDRYTLPYTDFACAPMKIITDEREFIDDESLDIAAMVAHLDTYKGKSKSSCPNPSDWLEAFGDADEVFCVTITGGLSGSYNSACTAKQIYEADNPGKRVFVMDTLTAGPEIALLMEKLEECIQGGMDFDEVCATVTAYQKKTGLLFMLKSLKTFAANGRVSPLVAKLVGIAGICIVGKASDEGTLEPLHKCRGEKRSLETIMEELLRRGFNGGKILIGHCLNEEAANRLAELIRARFPVAALEIFPFRGLCSFYAERGGVLVGFETP